MSDTMPTTKSWSDTDTFAKETPPAERNDKWGLNSMEQSPVQPSPPLMEQAKEQAHKVVEQTQQKASEAMVQARDKTKTWVDQQMESTAGTLGSVAHAVRQTGNNLRAQGQPPLNTYADFVGGTADAVDRAAQYLREANVDQVVSEVETFARRQPVAFLSIAAALGFFAVRFLRSSGRVENENPAGYNPDRALPVVMDSQDTGVRSDYGTNSFAP